MALFENFPYSDLHNLNLDWIIKIAKDFLDQYTHIQQIIADGETLLQQTIADGETSLQNLTAEELQQLQDKADNLETLLQAWYNEHSEDIANQLTAALADLNAWYTLHQNYLNQTLIEKTAAFNAAADAKAAETLESIPDDYTTLANEVDWHTHGLRIALQNTVYDNTTGEVLTPEEYPNHISNVFPIKCAPGTIATVIPNFQIQVGDILFYAQDGTYLGHTSFTNVWKMIALCPANCVYFNFNMFNSNGISKVYSQVTAFTSFDYELVNTNTRTNFKPNLWESTDNIADEQYWGVKSTFDSYTTGVTDERNGTDALTLHLNANTSKTGYFGTSCQNSQENVFKTYGSGKYIISFYAKSSRDINVTLYTPLTSGAQDQTVIAINNRNYVRYYVPINVVGYGNPDCYMEVRGGTDAVDLTLSHFKIELGWECTAYMRKEESMLVFPTNNPLGTSREYAKFLVPANVGKFVDNALAIQNNSHGNVGGVDTYGNAAIAFMDSAGVEHGAMGYSRNSVIQPAGWDENCLYIECGHVFGNNDGSDTSFKVIVSQNGNTSYFPNTKFYPIEHNTKTGETALRARGNKHVKIENGLDTDGLILHSANKTWSITIDDSGTISATEI